MEAFINLSDEAVSQINLMLAEDDMAGAGLRFGVQGGGCSGYSYVLEFVSEPEEGDLVQKIKGVPVFIPALERQFVKDCTIEWVDELLEVGFKIRNPNIQRTCGCGESFEVTEVKGEDGAEAPAPV